MPSLEYADNIGKIKMFLKSSGGQ